MSAISLFSGQKNNPEFQSAIVRFLIWLFLLMYIGFGAATEHWQIQTVQYFMLFIGYLVIFTGLFVSILLRPVWVARQYFSLAVDVSATSLAILLTQNAVSPVYLLYIWIFVSYGTRFGRNHLIIASVVSILAYALVTVWLHAWEEYAFEAAFFLLSLAILPFYQYSLLKQLHKARFEAEAANSARGRFLATMTHELRTPLSGILGMTRVMDTKNFTAEQKQQHQAVLKSAERLQSLIANILDFSKIDAEKLELENKPLDIRKTLMDVCCSLNEAALEKDLELVCSFSPGVPETVTGDALRLSQIVYNLLSNAIKFTRQGEILFTVDTTRMTGSDNDCLEIQVTDSGIGIAPRKLEHIFDAFEQADDSISRRFGGTGLGMAIVRNLVKLMNGDIVVESVEGQGSSFTVRLPLIADEQMKPLSLPVFRGKKVILFESNRSQMRVLEDLCQTLELEWVAVQSVRKIVNLTSIVHVDALIVADAPAIQDFGRVLGLFAKVMQQSLPVLCLGYASRQYTFDNFNCTLLHKPFSVTEFSLKLDQMLRGTPEDCHVGESSVQAVFSGKTEARILVAEDDPVSGQLITTLLNRAGYLSVWVEDGLKALHEARTGRYALAIVDLRMPTMDGLEFTRRLRKEQDFSVSTLPVVALTANAAEDVRDACQAVGMNDYLIKPIDTLLLDRLLEQFVPA